MSTSPQILIVDDDQAIVKLLQRYVEQAAMTPHTASNGASAMQQLGTKPIDLLILDLMLPDKDGWDITRSIRANPKLATLPIIMLTARIDDTDKIIGLELGADDYITKPFNAREVVARIRSLLRRIHFDQAFTTDNILKSKRVRLNVTKRTLQVDDAVVPLTRTEFQLLQVLMANPNHTLTREELMEKAMGHRYIGTGRALDTHIRNLRKKIEIDPDAPTVLQTIYGVGYRFEQVT